MLSDLFKGKQYREQLENLKNEHENLKSLMTPEIAQTVDLKNTIDDLNESLKILELNTNNKQQEILTLDQRIRDKKSLLINMDDEILVQEFGLYQPNFNFMNSEQYKEKIKSIRIQEKAMIKNNSAVTGSTDWTVNGNKVKGKKMVKDMQKLLLRAFNGECDELISKVKYNNYDASLKRMEASKDAISKLGIIMNVSITYPYFNLKIKELQLALEYALKKQEEKEEQRRLREEMREAAKLQKEIEEQRKKIQKEQSHYEKALEQIKKQLLMVTDNEELTTLMTKQRELGYELEKIRASLKDIDYRETNQRAGYVYIISNIGAFGENIYKIGMTRRLNPQDRVDELGDASVPFKFDVHAMIFSDDAPTLEAALHRAFEEKKLNLVNHRREFFKVSLDEIKEVVRKNYDKTVEFIDVPDAEQYRVSLKIKTKR